MIKLTTVLLALSIGTAHAGPFDAVLPPAEFDRPYKGRLTIKIVPDDKDMPAGCEHMVGCATPNGTSCVIHLRNDAWIRSERGAPEIVLRHEIGHCNGWGKDHAGARRIPPLEIEKYY